MSDPEDDAALQHAVDSAHAAWVEDEWPKGAVAMTKNLDLLADMDEPMGLVDELHKVAEQKAVGSPRAAEWELLAASLVELQSDLRAKNEPGRADDAKSE